MAEKRFESALKELEDIVARLEDEELPLEDSIALYEKGMKLSNLCSKKLKEAEDKIAKLGISDKTENR